MAFPDAGLHGQDVRPMTANEKIISAGVEPVEGVTKEITYREAIVAALSEEMRRDPKTLIMGEDIGESGGPFKTCQGLYD